MRRRALLCSILIAVATSASEGPSVGMQADADGRSSIHDRAASVRTTSIGDPEDIGAPCEADQDCPIDFRTVSRGRFTTPSGRKMLAFSVRAYELYGGLNFALNIKLRLDTRAGPRSDAHIFMAVTQLWADIGWACGREYHEGGEITRKYPIEERGDRLTCFVPRRQLHPTKRIRFQALSRGAGIVLDRAPERGWGGR